MAYTSFIPMALRRGELGPVARALRERRGLTLREAAAEFGVSASALSQAERNAPGVERLALRAVNEHTAKAAADGLIEPGHVRLQFQVYGGVKDIVAEVRAPEVSRRAGLLRQALIARGLDLTASNLGAGAGRNHARIDVGGAAVQVDLDAMSVSLIPPGRAGVVRDVPLGYVVHPDDDALDDEVWARSIDRFAGALVNASAGGHLDAEALRDALRPQPPTWLTSTSPHTPIE